MLAIEKEEEGAILLQITIVRRALNRVGSREYQELYIDRGDGDSEEVIRNGEYACAYETTAAFHNLGLLQFTHTTVDGFEAEALSSSDWVRCKGPLPGAIGILERKIHKDGSLGTRHTFTCINDLGLAVHNDAHPDFRTPQRIKIRDFQHHTGERRMVEAFYIHKKLL